MTERDPNQPVDSQETASIVGDLGRRDLPTERIGPYKVLEVLGEGGMGIVYLAEQEKPMRRRVALKIIRLGMDTREVIARFESERQALALMNHPNIAKVFDAGTTEQGRPYFVMEYVAGIPITEYCDKHRLSTPERLELFTQTCQAIQHAHQKGIIHRDIKPSNVLVSVQDGKGVPKVIDFGVAKATSQRLTEKTVFTQHGVLIGTLEYMSPEQAEMGGLDIDTTTDIYSLGVLLYTLLVGALPFDPKVLRKAGYNEMQRIIREEEPLKLSTRLSTLGEAAGEIANRRRTDTQSLRKQLRGDLDWIAMKAMEKSRIRRYAAASELAADIVRHLKNEPVVARPPSVAYHFHKFVTRHKGPFGLAAALVVLLVVFAVAMAIQAGRIAREAERANREAEAAEQVSDFLVGLFEVSDPSEARGNTVTAREILDKGAQKITQELKDQPLTQARLMNTIGEVYTSLGLYEQATPMLEGALTLRRNAHGDDHPDVAESLSNLATLYYYQGKYAEAEPLLQRALAIREKALGPDHPEVAKSLNGLASVYAEKGKYAKAEPLYQRSLAIQEKALGPDHPDLAIGLNNVALTYYDQGKYAEAEPLLQRALTIWEKALGPDHPDVATGLNNLAGLYRTQEKYAEAEPLFQRSLAIRERTLGPDHARVAKVLNSLAVLYEDQRKYAEAESLLQRSLAIREEALGPDHPEVAQSLHGLANLYRDQGKYAQAEPLYQRALAIRENALWAEHPDLAETLKDYAALLLKIGRGEEAEKLEARAKAIRAKQDQEK